jgi:hypothetical protein
VAPLERRRSRADLWRNTGRITSDADQIGDQRLAPSDKLASFAHLGVYQKIAKTRLIYRQILTFARTISALDTAPVTDF